MRRRGVFRETVVLGLFAALGVAAPAGADTDIASVHVTGDVETGGRAISGQWGSSKFNEYQDFRPGPFTQGLVLLEDEALRNYVRAQFQYVGSSDQLYRLEAGSWGRWGIDAGFSEYPDNFSNTARSLYTAGGGGDATFTLPLGMQAQLQGIAAAARKSGTLASDLTGAIGIPLGLEYEEGHAEVRGQLTDEIDGHFRYWTQARSGNQPLSIAFGSPGGNFANFAAPVDDRTQEFRTGLEWSKPGMSLAFRYSGSLYHDAIDAIDVANPLRATDSTTAGSSVGRLSAPPSNQAHSFDLTGAALLPVGFPLRLAGTFGYQLRIQNQDFLPETLNAAIQSPLLVLPRDNLHGQVNVWLSNVVLSGNPVRDLDFSLRYKAYEFDNQTGQFTFNSAVTTDSSLTAGPVTTEPLDWLRQDLGFDTGYRLTPELKLDLTAGWQGWRRSYFREVRNQNNSTVGAHLEARPAPWAVLRTGYSWANRRGEPYVVQADEFPALRKVDEANRVENKLDTLVQLTPLETLDFTLRGSYGYQDYVSSDFGVVNTRFWTLGGDLSWHPFDRLSFSAWYTYESNHEAQNSRNRPVVGGNIVDLASNDWSSQFKSGISTAGATANVVIWPERADLQFDWIFETSQSHTATTGASAAAGAFDWPFNGDDLLSIGPTLNLHLTDHLTLRGTYRYEHYLQNAFQTNPLQPFMGSSGTNSTNIFLANRVDNYNANVFGMSLQYRF